MLAVKGVVQGDVVVVDEAISKYQGCDVIVTILTPPAKKKPKKNRAPGIAKGKFVCPDDIDADNELIAGWFEGKE